MTHKGASSDGGHYIGFVKKSVFHPKASEAAGSDQRTIDDDDNDWYKFDDEKVSIFLEGKLSTLDGGGSCFVFRSSIVIGHLWGLFAESLISRSGCVSIRVIIQDETSRIRWKGLLKNGEEQPKRQSDVTLPSPEAAWL